MHMQYTTKCYAKQCATVYCDDARCAMSAYCRNRTMLSKRRVSVLVSNRDGQSRYSSQCHGTTQYLQSNTTQHVKASACLSR
eukprot:11945-Heterococcus_DN1.PRE.2